MRSAIRRGGGKLDQSNSRISLPKLGWIRYRNSCEVIGEVKTSRSASHAETGTSVSRQSMKYPSLSMIQQRWLVWMQV